MLEICLKMAKIGRNGRWGIKGVINEGINDENYSMKCSG